MLTEAAITTAACVVTTELDMDDDVPDVSATGPSEVPVMLIDEAPTRWLEKVDRETVNVPIGGSNR